MLCRLILLCFCLIPFSFSAYADSVLKIGVLGAMSGPAKYWGLTNKYCAEATAKMYNDEGGVVISGTPYKIEVVSYDTKLDPEEAIAGAKKLIEVEGVSYIIGPNIDDTSFAIVPLIEANNVVNFSYGFSEQLFQPPRNNTYLGMAHPKQSAPAIYKHLNNQYEIESVSFFARYDKESLNQRNLGIKVATELGWQVKDIDAWDIRDITYENNELKIDALAKSYSELNTSLIVLSGVAPEDTGKIITALRHQGYKGIISTETAQDPHHLMTMGAIANGFVSLGSSTPSKSHSNYMKRFIENYTQIAGQWHDEAGVKVYALETLLRVLQKAGKEAITNPDIFKMASTSFETPDPFTTTPRKIAFTGHKIFGDKKQLSVPFSINSIENGQLIIKAF